MWGEGWSESMFDIQLNFAVGEASLYVSRFEITFSHCVLIYSWKNA